MTLGEPYSGRGGRVLSGVTPSNWLIADRMGLSLQRRRLCLILFILFVFFIFFKSVLLCLLEEVIVNQT